MYEYGVMDIESSFMSSRDASPKKPDHDAVDLSCLAVSVERTVARVLSSDKLKGFKTGFAKVMRGRNRNAFSGPVHINSSAGIIKIKTRNSHFESCNGHSQEQNKDRARVQLGGSAAAQAACHISYFLRPHMGLDGRSPADVMGIKIHDPDKWATLIVFGASGCC